MKKLLIMIIASLTSVLTMYGQDKKWRFAVVGDTYAPQAYTIKKIIPSLIDNKVRSSPICGRFDNNGGKGQNVQGMYEELSQWNEFTQPLRDAGVKIIVIWDNHEEDVKGDNLKSWKEMISLGLNLVSTYKNVTFIGMDNYLDGEHTVDTGWLKRFLKKVKRIIIIVPFGYEPAFTCNTFHSVCLDANENSRNKFGVFLKSMV